MEDFIVRAALAALGISMTAGALGCFIIWKRMSYFSESIAHSALLGVALGLASGLGMHAGLLLVGAIFATFIVILEQKKWLSNDALLGIFSHVALSLGIVVLGIMGNANLDYFGFLFGDILSITKTDIVWIYVVFSVVATLLWVFWQRLLLLTLSEELAMASGLNRALYQLLLMLMIALAVSSASQIIGVLLITSLLIIPPAIAKAFAKSPVNMLFLSVIVAIVASFIGLGVSAQYDLATGPTIVIILGILFILSQFKKI